MIKNLLNSIIISGFNFLLNFIQIHRMSDNIKIIIKL